ncbi:tetratricopeptide repeat protein [Candidatus Tisiphia endosymbiont of Ditula angustiorana]|uniref:tetratricopeptide repeat protein n=1 Tax=Candidatus Tisiphia endosymbiont of Ditula angustiorana TaxID=3066272 RepID=UPI00312CA976
MKKYLLIIMVLIMPYTSVAQAEISNLVIPVSYFVDHVKQLTLVKNNLIKYRQTSLVGISGMGKTQLARMYTYENKNNYDLIWFIDCNLDINEEFLKLAKSINEKAKTNLISEDVRTVKKEVLSYLSSKKKWLLVFDNLKIKENHKVQEFVNWEHNGHVIFASQDSELLANTVKMTAFEKNDAITLANNILEKDDPKLAEFLVQEFVGYPILIVQGTQLLNQVPGLNQEEYKKRIRDSADKIKLNITLAIKELKPNAKRLLNKIALINNQAFSKELLKIIADDKNTIDDDIYQLSKFALISNTDPNETNPVFEMHDVIANKIMELNGNKNNKSYLEDIITKLMDGIPKNVLKGRIFRNTKTIRENMEIILKNAQKYNIKYKVMELRFHVLNSYLNIFDYYNAEKLVEWFNKNDKEGKLKLLFMNNNEKRIYAGYLGLIAAYYKSKYSDYNVTLEYYKKAQEVFKGIKGYNSYRYNILYNLASTYTILGQIQKAQENIQIIEKMFSDGLVDESELFYIYVAKAKLLFTLGEYTKALEQINGAVNVFLSNRLGCTKIIYYLRIVMYLELRY